MPPFRIPPPLAWPFALLCALAATGLHAQQDVHRCVDGQGQPVFTDRRCEDVGATGRRNDDPAIPASGGLLPRQGCVQRLSELVALLEQAVSAHDVNRLAGLYRWNAARGANATLDQLDAIVQRPLLDVQPIYPDSPGDGGNGILPPEANAARPRPIGLLLRQTLGNGSTPSSASFHLHREQGCFWISLM